LIQNLCFDVIFLIASREKALLHALSLSGERCDRRIGAVLPLRWLAAEGLSSFSLQKEAKLKAWN